MSGANPCFLKMSDVTAADAAAINAAIAAGQIIQVVATLDAGGLVVFGAESVALQNGPVVGGETFSLQGDCQTNTCDYGSTTALGGGLYSSYSLKIIQP